MSSGFVPAGTDPDTVLKNDDWAKAQQEVETGRRAKQQEGKQEDGKSLYDVLQANKAAKQEAFEESIRLKNQFRSLDDDEVDFLDSVLESTRAKEAAVKRETAEQLEIFRKQKEAAENKLLEDSAERGGNELAPATEGDSWVTRKKRRREKDPAESAGGLKVRRVSSLGESPSLLVSEEAPKLKTLPKAENRSEAPAPVSPPARSEIDGAPSPVPKDVGLSSAEKTPPIPNLGLGAYSSDEESS